MPCDFAPSKNLAPQTLLHQYMRGKLWCSSSYQVLSIRTRQVQRLYQVDFRRSAVDPWLRPSHSDETGFSCSEYFLGCCICRRDKIRRIQRLPHDLPSYLLNYFQYFFSRCYLLLNSLNTDETGIKPITEMCLNLSLFESQMEKRRQKPQPVRSSLMIVANGRIGSIE